MRKSTTSKNVQELLNYIDSYWEKIIIKPKTRIIHNRIVTHVLMRIHDKDHTRIHVPYTCIVPNDSQYKYIFYWDSYFMFQGLIDTPRQWIIPEMVENFIYLFKKYHIIPNLSHPAQVNRSQPPFLTSMIFDAYQVLLRDNHLKARIKRIATRKKHWLKTRIEIAKSEYMDVWQSPMAIYSYNHKVEEYNLNRYGDRDDGADHYSSFESGWDMTSRFYNRCNEFLPVDLNCYLYKYELDFIKASKLFKDTKEQHHWETIAAQRKMKINELMWNEKEGFFYDFDYVHKKQSTFNSLAGFVPMWVGLASSKQAKKMVQKLPVFETDFGLTITDKTSLFPQIDLSSIPETYRKKLEELIQPKQWDYPHIWAPLEYLTVIGLLNYGYTEDAKRIMQKSLKTHSEILKKLGVLLEKIDVTTGGIAKSFLYPNQFGFGWTNAIVYRYIKILESFDEST